MMRITQKSPSNIALIKYWGKQAGQIPINPSISMTLSKAFTETSLSWKSQDITNDILVKMRFNGLENPRFEQRIQQYIKLILPFIPALQGHSLFIESKNSFPHSTGIASSASAFSALALCLVDFELKLNNKLHFIDDYSQKASFLARLGSGSASRSIYSGYALWGKMDGYQQFSNDYAVSINHKVHPVFKTYGDAILIVSSKEKKVSSSAGHQLMKNHLFATEKFKQSVANTLKMLKILEHGAQDDFANLVESEALSLHAMMMTSNPSYLLIEPNTVALINEIRQFRTQTSIPVCFTLDAGANVHLLYPSNEKEKIHQWIEHQLLKFCDNKQWLDDGIK